MIVNVNELGGRYASESELDDERRGETCKRGAGGLRHEIQRGSSPWMGGAGGGEVVVRENSGRTGSLRLPWRR